MQIPRRQFLHLAVGTAALPVVTRLARAQTYPTRPITIIVPFAAGGTTDVAARIMAEGMKAAVGQSIIIENVSGANGSIGVGRAARAPPDGYTILIGQWSTIVVNGAIYALQYDLVGGFEPIAPIVTIPLVLYSKKSMPANDLKELITWLKANPDKASHATATSGLHALAVLFQKETSTSYQLVPYRGEAPATQDLIAGQIDLMWNSSNNLSQVRAGTLKAYLVTANARLPIAPEVPTAEEVGLPALAFSSWYGLFAPKSTPKGIIDNLNAAARDALSNPAVRQRFSDLGLDVFARDRQTSQVLGTIVKGDIEKWWPIIKAANIKGE